MTEVLKQNLAEVKQLASTIVSKLLTVERHIAAGDMTKAYDAAPDDDEARELEYSLTSLNEQLWEESGGETDDDEDDDYYEDSDLEGEGDLSEGDNDKA